MKKAIQAILILSSFLLVFSFQAFAGGKPFEGKITYEMSFPGSNFDAATLAAFPKEMNIYIKDNLSKTVMNTGMGKTINIFNSEEMYSVTLLDIMGQKYAIRSSSDMINEKIGKGPQSEIEYLDETKVIAGYTCKKAIVTIKDKLIGTESKLTVYYSDEFSHKNINKDNPIFHGINGIMLEYEIDAQGTLMKFTATSVEEKKISKKEFDIPKDYEVTTEDELKSKFGGM
ncbi:MAG: hypothetical protein K8R41_04220 [Bacteroidales bacterium]|nr:hypothetical protein [Bacteroidales bacterium]